MPATVVERLTQKTTNRTLRWAQTTGLLGALTMVTKIGDYDVTLTSLSLTVKLSGVTVVSETADLGRLFSAAKEATMTPPMSTAEQTFMTILDRLGTVNAPVVTLPS